MQVDFNAMIAANPSVSQIDVMGIQTGTLYITNAGLNTNGYIQSGMSKTLGRVRVTVLISNLTLTIKDNA